MIEKAKKHRLIFAVLGASAFVIAVALAVAVILLVRAQNYFPMWFCLGISVVGFYITPFLAFASADSNTAILLLEAVGKCEKYDVTALSEKLGWSERAVERVIKTCKKRGYLPRET